MTRYLIAFALLAACNTPGLAFRDVPATRVIIEGSVYDVRVAGDEAEAIRINEEYAPRLGPLGVRAVFAIEHVSRCKARKATGDAAVITALLKCPGQKSRPVSHWSGAPRRTLECLPIDSYVSGATNELITDFDCDWVD